MPVVSSKETREVVAPFLDKLEKVTLTPARKPGARYKDGVLEIDLTPGQGLAGRPSSRRIEAAFTH